MYHSDVGANTLKCDITALPNSQNLSQAIVLLNFNLPKDVVELNRDTELWQRLEEIKSFLIKQFGTAIQISYQVSASYWLKNKSSQDRYRWVGSFFAKNLEAASISGSIFLEFESGSGNFVQNVWEMLDSKNIINSLSANFLNSDWNFDELISVIISCQLLLPVNHTFLLQHGLLQRRGRRSKRTHVTLNPFVTVASNMSQT